MIPEASQRRGRAPVSTWQDAVLEGVTNVISRMNATELHELATESYRNIRDSKEN